MAHWSNGKYINNMSQEFENLSRLHFNWPWCGIYKKEKMNIVSHHHFSTYGLKIDKPVYIVIFENSKILSWWT